MGCVEEPTRAMRHYAASPRSQCRLMRPLAKLPIVLHCTLVHATARIVQQEPKNIRLGMEFGT